MDSPVLLYAVVEFAGASHQAVWQVTIPFESAEAADAFAVAHGHPDYAVAPVAFVGVFTGHTAH